MEGLTNCIYFIDDDEISNTLNTLILKDIPICKEILSFTDSEEAFNYLNNKKSLEVPHVIFVDYNLPFSTVEEITEKLKGISPDIKTVVLTAYVNKVQSRKIEENLNIDDLIFKPLTAEKLIESFKKMELI